MVLLHRRGRWRALYGPAAAPLQGQGGGDRVRPPSAHWRRARLRTAFHLHLCSAPRLKTAFHLHLGSAPRVKAVNCTPPSARAVDGHSGPHLPPPPRACPVLPQSDHAVRSVGRWRASASSSSPTSLATCYVVLLFSRIPGIFRILRASPALFRVRGCYGTYCTGICGPPRPSPGLFRHNS